MGDPQSRSRIYRVEKKIVSLAGNRTMAIQQLAFRYIYRVSQILPKFTRHAKSQKSTWKNMRTLKLKLRFWTISIVLILSKKDKTQRFGDWMSPSSGKRFIGKNGINQGIKRLKIV
jgi:hypothetical protein